MVKGFDNEMMMLDILGMVRMTTHQTLVGPTWMVILLRFFIPN